MKSCILAWMEQEAITGNNNFRLMLEVVCVHTLCWADGPMLGVVSGIQLPQYQGCGCHILASKTLLRGINWQILVFFHQGFSHNLVISFQFFPQSSYTVLRSLSLDLCAQGPALLHNPWIFSKKKTLLLSYSFQGISAPIQSAEDGACESAAISILATERSQTYCVSPCHVSIALCLQIPHLHTCHLRQQVGASTNVFVSKHRSD